MRAFVTGATGYIGSRLCRHLTESGWQVAAVVRPGSDLKRAGLPGGQCHEVSTPAEDLPRLIGAVEPDAVFHLAAAPPGAGAPDPGRLIAANVGLAAHLGEALVRHPGPVLVHAASWWEWDAAGGFAPANLYAATKAAGRVVLETAARTAPFAMASLVLHDVYGPGDWRGKVVDGLVRAARSGAALDLSPGEQEIDLVHVDDAVAAFETAARGLIERGSTDGPALHAVTSGSPVSLRALVQAVEAATGAPVRAAWGARPYVPHIPMKPGPMAPRVPGWAPAIDLAAGLASLVAEAGQ